MKTLSYLGTATAFGISAATASFADPAVDRCDALAADPADASRPAYVPGVDLDGIDGSAAVAACIAAVIADPDVPRLFHQAGRAYLANGEIEPALEAFATAADLGYAAAMFELGATLVEMGLHDDPEVIGLIEAAAAAGHVPALDLLGMATTSLDYAVFERPEIIQALVSGDVDVILDSRADVIGDRFGLSHGLALYLRAFDQKLSQPWYCPGLLPVGLDRALTLQLAGEIASRDTWNEAIRGLGAVFEHSFEESQFIREPLANARRGIQAFADIDAATREMTQKGERDAILLHQETQCEGPEVQALGRTVEILIGRLGT